MIPRALSGQLSRLATQYPVLTITGPRQAGKTTLCQMTFPDYDFVDLDEIDTSQTALNDPRSFLGRYSGGVILDEIQRVPDLPSYIKVIVDREKRPGRFVLTGSQQFEVMNTVSQSLAGRTSVIRLLPFTYGEAYGGSRAPSLEEALHRGFYPRIHDLQLDPGEALASYVATYVERDVRTLIAIKDMAAFQRFLGLCAANTAQLLNYSRLGADCGVDYKTVQAWLSVLQASYIVFLLPPFLANLRKRLTRSPKLYFYDVGLAAYLAGIRSAEQLRFHPLAGALFENYVVMEALKTKYNSVRPPDMCFYRDLAGHEVDLVLEDSPDRSLVEIKMGRTFQPEFTKELDYLAKLHTTGSVRKYVIYGGEERFTFRDAEIVPWREVATIVPGCSG